MGLLGEPLFSRQHKVSLVCESRSYAPNENPCCAGGKTPLGSPDRWIRIRAFKRAADRLGDPAPDQKSGHCQPGYSAASVDGRSKQAAEVSAQTRLVLRGRLGICEPIHRDPSPVVEGHIVPLLLHLLEGCHVPIIPVLLDPDLETPALLIAYRHPYTIQYCDGWSRFERPSRVLDMLRVKVLQLLRCHIRKEEL